MRFDYKVKSRYITELAYVIHKGKGPRYHLETQAHPNHEIIYVDYGDVIVELRGRSYAVRPGHCIFIRGGEPHSFHGMSKAPFDFLNICYKGVLPDSIEGIPLPVPSTLLELLNRLKDESTANLPYSKEISASTLAGFIYSMARMASSPEKAQAAPPLNSVRYRSDAVRKALSVIEQNFAGNITLASLASDTSVSVSYLRALIAKETGRNFSYHLQTARVMAAKRMLRASSRSVAEVAAAVGYSSLPFFFKAFRRFTGMTPREYAKSLGDPDVVSP